jgi:hypothetical protein
MVRVLGNPRHILGIAERAVMMRVEEFPLFAFPCTHAITARDFPPTVNGLPCSVALPVLSIVISVFMINIPLR